MTEADWLAATGPLPMLGVLRDRGVRRTKAGRRKVRLFACACCRSAWAEGVRRDELVGLAYGSRPPGVCVRRRRVSASAEAARGACAPSLDRLDRLCGQTAGAALLRDLFGNPFRPVAFSPEWRTDTALALASQMYESRDFSAMSILADALQDAGCDSADILDHCRGDGPHVRGCWVVDLVLGKE